MLPGDDERIRDARADCLPGLFKGLQDSVRKTLRLVESFALAELDQHFLLMGCLFALDDDAFRASYRHLRPAAVWRRFLAAVEGRLSRDSTERPNSAEYLRGLRALEVKVAGKVRPLLRLCEGIRDLSAFHLPSLPLCPESLRGKEGALLADSPEAWLAGSALRRAASAKKDSSRKDRKRRLAGKEERPAKDTVAEKSAPAGGGEGGGHPPSDLLGAACSRCGAPRSAIKESSLSARGTYACGAIYIAFSGPRQSPLVVKSCGNRKPPAPRESYDTDSFEE